MSGFQSKIYDVVRGSITVIIDSVPYTVDKSHPAYKKLLEAFKTNDANKFIEHLSESNQLKSFVQVDSTGKATGLVVDGNSILYNGTPLNSVLVTHILQMKNEGFEIDGMLKFLENLLKNPSRRSVEQLYQFLAHRNMPITEDGCFIAYKSVRSDYKDKHSGKFSNTVGTEISCERNMVDDDPRNTCSYGFHVGALKYSGPGGEFHSSGDKVVLCKVNPADVVAVPADHNAQKLRVCKYIVIDEFKEVLSSSLYGKQASVDEDIEEEICYYCDEVYSECTCDNDDTSSDFYDDEDYEDDEDLDYPW